MEMKDRLDTIVQRWNLLEHPFYRAWRAGQLPLESLQSYASEYGSLVRALPVGWGTVGADETVREEWEHVKLWDSFASALDTSVGEPVNPQTIELVGACDRLFAEPDTALGALYAFEAQQPETSASKLQGLRLHYKLSAASETYFDAHIGETRETQDLLSRLNILGEEGQERALAACESMCLHLWNALEGLIQHKPVIVRPPEKVHLAGAI
ncbi:MAG: iron-containing redox enzyme family protein [Anaerolineales bacterium]